MLHNRKHASTGPVRAGASRLAVFDLDVLALDRVAHVLEAKEYFLPHRSIERRQGRPLLPQGLACIGNSLVDLQEALRRADGARFREGGSYLADAQVKIGHAVLHLDRATRFPGAKPESRRCAKGGASATRGSGSPAREPMTPVWRQRQRSRRYDAPVSGAFQ